MRRGDEIASLPPEQKVEILKRHLIEKFPVSEIGKAEYISPKQFYDWQKVLFEGASSALKKETVKQMKEFYFMSLVNVEMRSTLK